MNSKSILKMVNNKLSEKKEKKKKKIFIENNNDLVKRESLSTL